MTKSLFDDDEEEHVQQLRVNEDYAKRFEVGCPQPCSVTAPPVALQPPVAHSTADNVALVRWKW